MTKSEPAIVIRGIVREMALDVQPISEVTDALSLRDDLHFDSLTLANLIFRLQDEFALSVADIRKHLVQAKTVGELVVGVEKLIVRAASMPERAGEEEGL